MIKIEPMTPWKILVVDDDFDIHEVTELALKSDYSMSSWKMTQLD